MQNSLQKPSFLKRQFTRLNLEYHLHKAKKGDPHQFTKILHVLDQYESHCGIPSHLIKNIFCQTIYCVGSKKDENIRNICDLNELIQNKFSEKMDSYSKEDLVILKALNSFSDLIIESNSQSGLFCRSDEVHLIHSSFLKIMEFHLKILLDKKHLRQIEGHDQNISKIMNEYKKFFEYTVEIKSNAYEIVVASDIQNVFNVISKFVVTFQDELEDACYNKILTPALDILEIITTNYQFGMKGYFQHEIIRIAQSALEPAGEQFQRKIAKSLKIAKIIYSRFFSHVQDRKHIFLEELEDLMAVRDPYGKHPFLVKEEYISVVRFYIQVISDCPLDVQEKFKRGLVLKAKTLMHFDIFLNDLIKNGLEFSKEDLKILRMSISEKGSEDVTKYDQFHEEARIEMLTHIKAKLKCSVA